MGHTHWVTVGKINDILFNHVFSFATANLIVSPLLCLHFTPTSTTIKGNGASYPTSFFFMCQPICHRCKQEEAQSWSLDKPGPLLIPSSTLSPHHRLVVLRCPAAAYHCPCHFWLSYQEFFIWPSVHRKKPHSAPLSLLFTFFYKTMQLHFTLILYQN